VRVLSLTAHFAESESVFLLGQFLLSQVRFLLSQVRFCRVSFMLFLSLPSFAESASFADSESLFADEARFYRV